MMETSGTASVTSRYIAPRPTFMSQVERAEYEAIHRFLRERQEAGVEEQRVLCRFYNTTDRDVDVIWCRHENEEDFIYGRLPPKRFFELRTFMGHPWMFRASDDGERMGILKSESRVHFPYLKPWKMVNTNQGPIAHQVVFIGRAPVGDSTLKELCIRQISNSFSTDQICALQMPNAILFDLLEFQINRIVYVNALSPTVNLPEKMPAVKTVAHLKQLIADLEAKAWTVEEERGPKSTMRAELGLPAASSAEPGTSVDVERRDESTSSGHKETTAEKNENSMARKSPTADAEEEPPAKRPK